MYLPRRIDFALREWKNDKYRKPLLLRGARQTGKTTAVRNFGAAFDTFIEVNFEKDTSIAKIFDGDIDVKFICRQIEGATRKRIEPGKTLLFFDEIQACPRAISSLRYFYEDYPELHVIATGSLLEFVFNEIKDFGVGRIRNAFMYPFSFQEFALALGEDILVEQMREATFDNPVPPLSHERMLDLLKIFLIVGGMPSAVGTYVEERSFLEAERMHKDVMTSLKADFGKYSKRIPASRIRNTLTSIIRQTGGKFTYTDSLAGLTYRQSREAIDLLELSKIVVRSASCHANGLPLGGDLNSKANKFMLFDTGLYMNESDFSLSANIILPAVEFINKGWLAEMFVGLELLKAEDPFTEHGLYYWHREAAGSTAEVDYLLQRSESVLPLEVKSGRTGKMKSLGILMREKGLRLGLRTSQENISSYGNIRVIPLYMIGEWRRLLADAR